jgi:transcription initiation factor TFIID subunit 6
MSINKETIHVFAQAQGHPKLKEDIAQYLANEADSRLREIIQEATKFMKHSKRKFLTSSDVNNALKVKNIDPVYGYSTRNDQKSHQFKRVPTKKTLYYLQDNEINIKEALQTPLPKIPLGPSITAHWLCIEGIQPKIPQNPIQAEREEKLDEDKKETNIEVKPLVKHVLSSELQLYYEKMVSVAKGETKGVEMVAIQDLSTDAGIQQLVPYFAQFISEQVTTNLKKLEYLARLMQMTYSLMVNPHLSVEFYLHQFIPPVLTCLVAKRLCEDSRENHWSLRMIAAEIIAFLCNKYGPVYHTLQKRITKTL